MGFGDIRKKKEAEVDVPIKKKKDKRQVPFSGELIDGKYISGVAISNLEDEEETEEEEDEEEDEEDEEEESVGTSGGVV